MEKASAELRKHLALDSCPRVDGWPISIGMHLAQSHLGRRKKVTYLLGENAGPTIGGADVVCSPTKVAEPARPHSRPVSSSGPKLATQTQVGMA
jgi:hypothetical protein